MRRTLLSKVDFHVHSAYSGEEQCEGFTIPRICQLADRMGIEYLLLTDHWKREEDIFIFKRERTEIERCKRKYKVKILLSAEIDVINSKGDTAIDLKKAKEVLDIISASPHHYGSESTKQLVPDILEDARDMVINIAKNKNVDLILHPQITGNVMDKRPVPKEYYYEMMQVVKKNDKAVECTSIQMLELYVKFLTKGKDWNWWSQKLVEDYSNYIQAVVESRVKFVIGTDAHNERLAFGESGGIPWPRADSSHPWFGATEKTVDYLRKYNANENNLWIPHLKH